jgi:hypothetical protein
MSRLGIHAGYEFRNRILFAGLAPLLLGQSFENQLRGCSALPMNMHFGAAALGRGQRFALVVVSLVAACGAARGQMATEHTGTSSVSATTDVSGKSVMVPPPRKATAPKASRHLVIPDGLPPEVANRKALEQRAGRDAGKLLLRSVPSPARAWVNGAFVGNTPLLLILAPGKYQLEVGGQRLESAGQTVNLLPRETRDVALQMTVRSPTTVSIH